MSDGSDEGASQAKDKKAEARTPESDNDTSPAGWAGVVQVLINSLGEAAKYAVIVAGLLIALYFFIAQYNKITSESTKAREESEKFNQQKLEAADKRVETAENHLLAIYDKFDKMGSQQVAGLNAELKFRDKVETESRNKSIELLQSKENEHDVEQQLAARKAEIQKLTDELDSKAAALNTRENQLDKLVLSLEQEQQKLNDANQQRFKQAETFNLIKDNLIDLATKVDGTTDVIDGPTKALAGRILRNVVGVDQRLKDFMRTPNAQTFTNLKPILIGMPRKEFVKIRFQESGASLLTCLTTAGLCAMAISQNEYSYQNVMLLDFEKGLLVNPLFATALIVIKLHATKDWNKLLLIMRTIGSEPDTDVLGSVAETWTLEGVLEELSKETPEVVFGASKPVVALKFQEYTRMFPDDYKVLLNARSGEASVSLGMEARSVNYAGVKVGTLALVPNDIVECFNEVAKAAVERRDRSTLAHSLDASLDSAFLGRLGAVLLKRDFQIIRYQSNPGDANAGSVSAEYHPLESGSETRTATFQFRRAGPSSPWRLVSMNAATS